MAHDWQVGDLAICVDDDPCPCCGGAIPGLRAGKIYTVADVFLDFFQGEELLFLEIAELINCPSEKHDESNVVDADSFRKIRPDEQSGSIEDWNLLLETHKRRVGA